MRFHVVANAARECVAGFADRLYGCSHKLKAFPITLGAETYVVLGLTTRLGPL